MTQPEIESFLAICRYKNGTRAAESLYITQSSLATRLKTLERELGGKLFVRGKGKREMVLTPAGTELYKLAMQYEAIVKKMENVCVEKMSVLRVSAFNSIATYFIYDICDRFIKLHPGIELDIQELTLKNAVNGIQNGTTDIAFTCEKVVDPLIRSTFVFSEPMVVIADAGSDYPDLVGMDALSPEKEIYNEWTSDFAKWHLSEFPGHDSPKVRVTIMAHLRRFFEKGDAWAIVPLSVANGLKADIGVKILNTDFPLPTREISYLTAKDSANTALINAFTECLDEVIRK